MASSRILLSSHICMTKSVIAGEELTDDDVGFILSHTKFSEAVIRKQFESFRKECPGGKLTKGHLHSLFKKIFPVGDSEIFCNHIFRIFDSDGNGFLASSSLQ